MGLICTSEFFTKLKLHKSFRRVEFQLFEKLTSVSAGRSFLKPFFLIREIFFSDFPHKIFVTILRDIRCLRKFPIVFQLIIIQNYDVVLYLHCCYTFYTDVTHVALVFDLNCTALSQSESSNFFMCIINSQIRKNRHSDKNNPIQKVESLIMADSFHEPCLAGAFPCRLFLTVNHN